MKFSDFIRLIKYYAGFIPFKINFLVYCIVVFFSYKLIKSYQSDTHSFIQLTILMAKIALIFSIVLVTVSFFSTLICTLYFYHNKINLREPALDIKMDTEQTGKPVLNIHTKIKIALKPILGFVSVRLFYDKHFSTEKYLLTDRIKKQFFPFFSGLSGENKLGLPHIKEYYFSHALVYFEDMLKFFSFAVPAAVQQSIMNLPYSLLKESEEILPKKTEEETIRIEQLRKVEGELLNYKKFEDSDDVRRIVWKIFAKSRELMVRTPEIMDPFASHLYLYASFYAGVEHGLYPEYSEHMLNYFKNCVWTIFDTLAHNDFEIKYISDQPIGGQTRHAEKVRSVIAISSWHKDQRLNDYFKPAQASVLCIHSFTPVEDVEAMLAKYETGTSVFFVQMSKVFRSYYLFNWLMRIFFRPPQDTLSKLKAKWAIHPLKFKVLPNENKIMALLKKQDINFEVI